MDTRLSVRRIVVAGLLAAVTILLGATRLGFIPTPTPAGDATIVHIPAILGGILEGSLVGGIIGLVFGLLSFIQVGAPMFKDPLISILPRIFVGITPALVYALLKRRNEIVAVILAAIVGTFTNTILVLGMAVLRGYIPAEVAIPIGLMHGTVEAIVAAIIVSAVIFAWKGLTRARKSEL